VEWENYKIAFNTLMYFRTMLNSIIVTSACTLGHITVGAFIGYGFARFRFPGKNTLFFVAIISIIIPIEVLIIPQYINFVRLGWINSYLPVIVPVFLGYGLRGGIFIFIFRQFFLNSPYELEEAAYIDGCGPIATFARIMYPTSNAAILVCSILSIVWHWNDFYEPMIYINSAKLTLLPSMLNMIQSKLSDPDYIYLINMMQLTSNNEVVLTYPILMAGVLLVILPVIAIYLFLQKRFMASIERTGIIS
jgi:multiple sugar transport system permease protein